MTEKPPDIRCYLVSGGFFYNLSVSLLKIGEAYPRRENKLTASTIKNVHPRSFYCSSGMDASGLNRSDILTVPKLAVMSKK